MVYEVAQCKTLSPEPNTRNLTLRVQVPIIIYLPKTSLFLVAKPYVPNYWVHGPLGLYPKQHILHPEQVSRLITKPYAPEAELLINLERMRLRFRVYGYVRAFRHMSWQLPNPPVGKYMVQNPEKKPKRPLFYMSYSLNSEYHSNTLIMLPCISPYIAPFKEFRLSLGPR